MMIIKRGGSTSSSSALVILIMQVYIMILHFRYAARGWKGENRELFTRRLPKGRGIGGWLYRPKDPDGRRALSR